MNFAVGSAILTLAMTTLAGCSGGDGIAGGGGPDVGPRDSGVDFTGFSNMSENGTTNFEGTARSASLSLPHTGFITMSSPSGSKAAKATMETQNGNLVAVGIDAPGASVSVGPGNGATIEDIGSVNVAVSGRGTDVIHLVDSQEAGYEYQTYGAWFTAVPRSGSGIVGVGSFGAKTTSKQLPGGRAVYTGRSTGWMGDTSGELHLTESEVIIDTDFSTASISSTATLTNNLDTEILARDSSLDFSGSGPVSGTGFTAQVTGRNNGNLTGSANGQFYGTVAQEVGGTFGLESSSGQTYIGSFGAEY